MLSLICIALLAACSTPTAVVPDQTPQNPTGSTPAATPTEALPSPTPAPMVARVDGEGILQAEFDAELARYQAAQQKLNSTQEPTQQHDTVLQDLIDETLLAQAAYAAGFSLDDAALQARIDQLAAQIGGADALAKWQSDHGYTDDQFKTALRRSAAAAWQRDQIMAQAPITAEQVHVRQILVYTRADADYALSRLVPGLDFATLAFKYDTITGGDLGWFPKGYLLDPAVEEAAFALTAPDQLSPIVEGATGFHILQLIERDANHLLSPDARLALQKNAVRDWLQTQRDQSQIEILTP